MKPGDAVRGGPDRGSAPGADRDRAGLVGRDQAGGGAGQEQSTSPISLERAPMRTIAGQAGYGTGEGIRVEASWQHRNLIPPEGAVTFRGVVGTQEQLIGAVLRRNNFLRRDQVLTAQVVVSHIDRAAYDARTFDPVGRRSSGRPTSSGRRNGPGRSAPSWSPPTSATSTSTAARPAAGPSSSAPCRRASATTARTTCSIRRRGYRLVRPLLARSVAPVRHLRLCPRPDRRQRLSAGHADRDRWPAGSGSAPSSAPSRDRIAPSRRFYAGGGGSVRGYGFQRLGPRDPVFDDPIGGRSLTEFAIEARIRWGNFGRGPVRRRRQHLRPRRCREFDNLRFGAGIGVRYHTSFGPIRVDVGTPLNRAQRRFAGRGLRLARPGLLMDEAPPSRRARRRAAAAAGCRRLAKWAVGLVLGLAVARPRLLAVLLDTGAGPPLHRRPDRRDGAEVRAAASGSAGSRARSGATRGCATSGSTIRKGLFAESPVIEVDWRPLGWIANRLVIHRLETDLAILHRLPEAAAERASRGRSCPASTSMSDGSTSPSSGSARR